MEKLKILLFGARGMVGQGILRECLLDADVNEVKAVGRSRLRVDGLKLKLTRLCAMTLAN